MWPPYRAAILEHILFALKHETIDLPNRTINLLIPWGQQNNGSLPRRRLTAPEVVVMRREQIERVEAIVAGHFGHDTEQHPEGTD